MVFYLEGDVVFGEVEHFVDLFEVVEGGEGGIGGHRFVFVFGVLCDEVGEDGDGGVG